MEPCIVPDCNNVFSQVFIVDDPYGYFAGKKMFAGDVIKLCYPHSSELRKACDGSGEVKDWMKNVPPECL